MKIINVSEYEEIVEDGVLKALCIELRRSKTSEEEKEPPSEASNE